MTTLTIMRILPREVDPMVYKMSLEDPGGASFAGIGGLGEQVRELREVRSYPLPTIRTLTPHSLRSSSSPS
jgi:26S proteasome regulatory subunit T4